MYDCKLLLEECEDMRHICEEIGSRENFVLELQFPNFSSRKLRESLERIVHLVKIYFTLIVRIACSSSSDLNNSVKMLDSSSGVRLSSLAYTLWKNIHTLKKEKIQNEVIQTTRELEKSLISEGSQTNVTSLVDCENCDISKKIIKQLVREVDELCKTSGVDSFIGKFRQELRLQLLEVTDWYSMTHLAEAVIEDVKNLPLKDKKGTSNKKAERAESKRKLKEIIKNLEIQLGYGPKTSLGIEIQKLNKVIQDLKQDLSNSREETQEQRKLLEISEKSNKTLADEIFNLKRLSFEDKEKVKCMEGKIEDKILELTSLIKKYEHDLSECKKTIINIKLENVTKQKLIEQQLLSIKNLEKQLDEWKVKETNMNETILTLKNGISSMEKYEIEKMELLKQLKEKTEKSTKLKDRCKELQKELKSAKSGMARHSANESEISLTGETEIDIRVQKVFNENRIELLKEKNKKLETTLNKIQNSRSSKTKVTPPYREIKIKNESKYSDRVFI